MSWTSVQQREQFHVVLFIRSNVAKQPQQFESQKLSIQINLNIFGILCNYKISPLVRKSKFNILFYI